MFGTACSPWEVNTAWACAGTQSTLVPFLGSDFGQEYNLATLKPTATTWRLFTTCPLVLAEGWGRAMKQVNCSHFPMKMRTFGYCIWVVLAGMQETWRLGIEVVWQPFLCAGRHAALISNRLPLVENECCCWERLLHSTRSRDVPSSHLPAAGSRWVQQRGFVALAHGLFQEGFVSLLWLFFKRYLSREGAQGCCLQYHISPVLGTAVSQSACCLAAHSVR